MDGAILPLNFYCRNARLCLRKASFSKKANLPADELQHLIAFTTLVSSTIPLHPLYPDRKDEKPFVELRTQLPEVEGRILELEAEGSTTVMPIISTTDGKPSCLKLEKSKEQSSQRKANSLLTSSPRSISDSMSRAEKRTTTNPPKEQPCLKSLGPVTSTSSKTQGKGSSIHVPKMKGIAVDLLQEGSVVMLHPSGLSPSRKCSIHGFPGGSNQATSKCCVAHCSSSSSSSMMMISGVSRCEGGKEMSMRAAPMATVKCKQKLVGGGSSLEQGIVNREEDTQVMSMGVAAAEITEGEMTRRCAQSNGTSGHQCEEVCYRKPTLAESGRGGLLEGSEEQNNELNVETNFTVSNCREHHGQQHHSLDSLHGRHGHVPQGEGLKEWKGGFMEGDRQYELEGESSQPQKFEEGNGGLYSERNNPARVGLGQGGSESGKLLNARPTSAPRRMQGAAASGERVKFPKGERIDINISNGRNRSAMGTYKSRGVKGVKEDCDRFRHQMQVLKEKAEDSRVREVEVEGMVDRLQKCTVDENDTVATRKGVGVRGEPPKSHRTARFSNKERLEFENIYTSPRISPTQNGALGCKLNISPPPPPHLHERPLLRWKPEVMKDAHKEFEARKTIPALTACLPSYTNSTSSSSSGSSMSSLPSLPLSHYIQKLKHLAPKSHLPASSRALYTPGSKTAAAMVGCCNPCST